MNLRWMATGSVGVTLALAGCPADDSSAEGGSGDSSTGAESSTGASSLDGTSTTPPGSTGPGTTTMPPGDSSGGDSSTGDPPPPSDGMCFGIDLAGFVGNVLSRDGMPIDTTCDPTPMPCGGDPVGTWVIESTCGYDMVPNPLKMDCPGSTFEITMATVTGMLVFENDGTWMQDLTSDTEAVITLDPMMCFAVDCATFESILQGDSPAATCQAMGMSCECTIPGSEAVMAAGTWQVNGDQLTLEAGGEVEMYPFCIAGDRFDFWNPIGAVVPTDTLCATDQDCADALGDMYDAYVCSLDEG